MITAPSPVVSQTDESTKVVAQSLEESASAQEKISERIQGHAKSFVDTMNPHLQRSANLQAEFDNGIKQLKVACQAKGDRAPVPLSLKGIALDQLNARQVQSKRLSSRLENQKKLVETQASRYCGLLLRPSKRSESLCRDANTLTQFGRIIETSLQTQAGFLVDREKSLNELRTVAICLSPARMAALDQLLKQEIDQLDLAIEIEIVKAIETVDRFTQNLR